MKKFCAWCLATLIAGVFAIVGSTALISCEQTGPKILEKNAIGVEQVSICLDSIVNPRLSTCRDVFELQNKLLVNNYIDSVFMSMDQKTLENVAGVCLNRLHIVTKDDIVSEFIKNRAVYDNLPVNNPPDTATVQKTTKETPVGPVTIVKEETTTVTEAPPTRVEEKSANSYRDTTIDGKRALIQIH